MTLKGKRIDLIVSEYSNVPAQDFVKALNTINYKHYANEYDLTHPDITYDAAFAWNRIIEKLGSETTKLKECTIVDIGSGTGFVATQFLENSYPFHKYIGLEPSIDMMKLAIKRNNDQRITFKLLDLSKNDEIFSFLRAIKNMKIITLNSVLHHIIWWENFLIQIQNSLKIGDLLVFCHEPNSRFWQNELLTRNFNKVVEEKMKLERIKFYLNPINYVRKLLRILGFNDKRPYQKNDLINNELKNKGLIKKQLPHAIVNAIVDYGVPLCWKEIPLNRDYDEGFLNIDRLTRSYFLGWKILLSFTYQHLAISTKILSQRWKKEEKKLEEKYPQDGAQFCLVIQKS